MITTVTLKSGSKYETDSADFARDIRKSIERGNGYIEARQPNGSVVLIPDHAISYVEFREGEC